MRRWCLLLVLVGCNQLYGLDETVGPPPIDSDKDEIPDEDDNCVLVPNVDQANADDDTFGDACDPCVMGPQSGIDVDTDGVDDSCDACTLGPNHDEDGDTLFDGCDNCPGEANDDQADVEGDGVGDACDPNGSLANQRVFFDGFAPPDVQWNTGFAEWIGTGDGFAPVETPSAIGPGPWNRRGKVTANTWQMVVVVELPAAPPNNMRVGLTTIQPATVGPDPKCEIYFDAQDGKWHNDYNLAPVNATSPLRITMRLTPRVDMSGPNADVMCIFNGDSMADTNGYFANRFFPMLLLRNGTTEFRYLDVVQ